MKLKSYLLTLIFLSAGMWAMAQGGPGGPRRSVEDRVKAVHEKFEALKLEKDKLTKVDEIFTKFYKDQDKLREEMMSGGERPDFQAMREKMQKMSADRDEKLKKIFTEYQYKKWKDEIEPSMRPQRGGGGPRGGGAGGSDN